MNTSSLFVTYLQLGSKYVPYNNSSFKENRKKNFIVALSSFLSFNIFLYTQKTSGHLWCSDVFRVCRYRPVSDINPFVPSAPFLYPLKTSEKRKVFWCFQGVEKGYIGKKWVKWANINNNDLLLSGWIQTRAPNLLVWETVQFLRTSKNDF